MLMSIPAKRRFSTVAVSMAALAAMSGAGFAAGLPGAASSTASTILQGLGVTTPGPNPHSGTHSNGAPATGNSVSALATTTSATGADKGAAIRAAATTNAGTHKPAGAGDTGKGSQISTLATTTTASGVDKGAAISTAASGGESQAGQHGGGQGNPPVSTPNGGGTGTGDQASGGHSGSGSGNGGH